MYAGGCGGEEACRRPASLLAAIDVPELDASETVAVCIIGCGSEAPVSASIMGSDKSTTFKFDDVLNYE